MAALGFLRLALLRLLHRRGLSALLVLSAAVAIGVVTSVPVFSGAVSLRIMQQELGLLEGSQNRPPFVVRFYAQPSRRQPIDLDTMATYRRWLADLVTRLVRVPIVASYVEVQSSRYEMLPRSTSDVLSNESRDAVYVIYSPGVERELRIVEGAPFGQDADPDALAVWIARRYADELALAVGDTYEVGERYVRTGRIPIKIAGIWEPVDPDARYWWYTEPIWHYEGILLTSADEYARHVLPALPIGAKFISWRYILDHRRMDLGRGGQYVAGLEQAQREARERLPGGTMDEAPTTYLVRGQARKEALSIVLLGFVLPLMAIIIYFTAALSTLVVRYQRQEISMLISRGTGRLQILAISLAETLLLIAISTPLGLLLGLGLAHLLARAESFMRFGAGVPLEPSMASADWRLVAGAALVTALARLAPTWGAARRTIVAQERENARASLAPGALRLVLIAGLSAATWYAYRQLTLVGTLGLVSWTPGDRLHDPLLLLAPSLFMLTAPLIIAELFVWLVRPIGWAGRLARHAPLYLGAMDLARAGGAYRAPVYMLVVCLSLGVFYASLAKSADAWLLDRRRYETGGDLAFHPRGTAVVAGRYAKLDPELVPDNPTAELASLVPASAYEAAPGVAAASPVGEYEATLPAARQSSYLRLLAVDRITFPQVAYFRPDYASEPLGALMNRLGARQDALLLPEKLAAELQLAPGDQVLLNVLVDEKARKGMEFTLVGTFAYFPTMFPDEALMGVANLDYVQFGTAGVLPFSIWLRTAPGAQGSAVVQAIASRLQVLPEYVADLRARVTADQARLERLGIFGVLSVCFIAGALLSALGLLMHSLVSLRARALRFAVLQALGLEREGVLATVFFEYGVVLLFSVLSGTVLGILAAQRYVPFFQITESAAVPVPPYLPLIDEGRAVLLAMVMIVALVLAQGAILHHLARTRLFEVLRMGTRE
ncbi:MAG: ABC transporter permease [Chloroflexota bacterium]